MNNVRMKLAQHLKKVLSQSSITSSNIEQRSYLVVYDLLCKEFTEYLAEPIEKLMPEMKLFMDDYLQKKPTSSNSGKTMSLNQAMAMKQNAMKRSRPIEVASTNDSKTKQDESDAGNDEPVVEQSKANGDSQSLPPETKRRKTISSSSSSANLSQGNSGNNTTSVIQYLTPRPQLRFTNLAGLQETLKQINELIINPLKYPHIYQYLGICPPCGILLHGPSGCGKTSLATAIAGETGLPYYKVSGPELIGGTSGESEERIRTIFDLAIKSAPSILFIDAIDVIAAKKDSTQRGMDRRVIAQLLDCIDSITALAKPGDNNNNNDDEEKKVSTDDFDAKELLSKNVILIVSTNKPEVIDSSVRGRFSREIALPVPDANARREILQLHAKSMRLGVDVDFAQLGKVTPGFVGADLQALCREAGMTSVARIIHKMQCDTTILPTDNNDTVMDVKDEKTAPEVVAATIQPVILPQQVFSDDNCAVIMDDFLKASKSIQPAAKREGFAIAPDVTWNDVGALVEVREELKHNILEPIAHPERFRALGLDVPAGVLFFGPPGCGKTLLAKALANQSGANFISVKGPELLNMYVGESESRVRQVFARARASAPCVIFFDELDALCPKRSSGFDGGSGGSGGSSNGVSERVVNQLLTELDGLESRKDVYIIGATNRLELIDEAMLRPGRLGNLLYVPLPTADDRVSILQALTRKVSVATSATTSRNSEEKVSDADLVDLQQVAFDARAEGFSGADLSALVREAGMAVIKEMTPTVQPGGDVNEEMNMIIASSTEGGEDVNGRDRYNVSIQRRHFETAFQRVRPSVSIQDRKKYELVRSFLKEGASAIESLRKAFGKNQENDADSTQE